ncbi:MAG: prepilin peptidase [Pseudomonadota bacterium]|nr:prepilin peptidase [Pseudomonadota bacterium]
MISVQPALLGLMVLPFATVISIWVAISDMSRMKIPNKAVMALFVVFAVIGLVAVLMDVITLPDYLWRYAHLAVVLLIGFVMNAVGLLGAGDAKFAAAMAPFVALGDLSTFALIFAAAILGGFVLHRIAKRIPFIRNAFSGWESWERDDFPMGLCLGIGLVAYLAVVAVNGA